jgi:deazaflavin-dependent oxidoreductase (nitroreductase family)
MINRLGATPAGVWVIKNLVSPLQRWVYRSSRGKRLSNMGSGRNVLLLTTKGRRTGKDRTIPVFYLRDGDAIVICNVRPQSERGTNPWVLNLRSHPVARLQIGSDIAQYHAREATAD